MFIDFMKNLRFVFLIFISQFILMGCGILAKFPIEKKVEIKTMDYSPLVNSKIKRVELTLRGKDDIAIQNFVTIIEKSKKDSTLNVHISKILADQIYKRHYSLLVYSSIIVGLAAGGFVFSLELIDPGNEYLASSVAIIPSLIYLIPGTVKGWRALNSTYYLIDQYGFGKDLYFKKIKFYRH